jgi:tRNA-dihydrouridine synthase
MVACEQLAEGDADTKLRSEGIDGAIHVVQLAGREAHWMAEGARIAVDAGADIIDINMGCPAKRVTTGYSGSALMRDLDHAVTLIEATIAASSVPVTVKMRLGWDSDSLNKGTADWDAIGAVRARIGIPLVANGDCASAADARDMRVRCGADAVMIGRSCYGRPWLAGQIGAELAGREPVATPAGETLADLVCEHVGMMLDHYGTARGLMLARKHIAWYLDAADGDMPGEARKALLTSTDPRFVLTTLARWFSSATRLGEAA